MATNADIKVTYYLRPNLTSVRIDNFNEPINNGFFYEGITEIYFGDIFNQYLSPGIFPSTLTKLSFGNNFSFPIGCGVFPPNLKELVFHPNYNNKLDEGVSGCTIYIGDRYCYALPELFRQIIFIGELSNGVLFPALARIVLEKYPISINNPTITISESSITYTYKPDIDSSVSDKKDHREELNKLRLDLVNCVNKVQIVNLELEEISSKIRDICRD
jgi:hypothetical protein